MTVNLGDIFLYEYERKEIELSKNINQTVSQ